ncbi:unnamed protein product [Phytophthora fragariaefolia]|uniref:Unnamed protein product n=1 Tax=Phytophthora fragariaefolia TaxID=1490495 RepID=A0A9W6YFH5_9STRA|nr:unnamed protein product [Phytophthora fragariaefolia]
MGRVVLSSDRKAELKELNRVSEILYTNTDSADSGESRAEMTVMTGRQTRRVHFEDEAYKDSAGISQNTGSHDKEANSPNSRAEGLQFESPRAPKRFCRVEDHAEVEVSEGRIPDATDIDPAVVQAERRRRISKAQDEELRWADLKALLRGELDSLTHRRAQNASKIADSFVLSEDGLLCHNSIEGGHQGIVRTFHRVKAEFYWVGLYADVSKHVQTCEDCSTSKSKPQLRGYSPGNVTSEYPFQMVSMDFVIPLPVTRRGNTALLLFQDHFTEFVVTKAMSETGALEVAKAIEECVFRRFGAPSLIRHDRDPRFMSAVFQAFAELMQSRSRATLSYRPQANGHQERSVKTMIQTVRAYVEDPLQADWDDIAEKMVHAINNSRDTTRRETPFYLVHGWDAQSTLKSMTSTIKKDPANSADAAQCRREANRQREIALQLAKAYQLAEKAQRAEAHNARLSGKEKRSLPESTQLTRERSTDNEDADSEDEPAEPQKSLFRAGDQVWLSSPMSWNSLTKADTASTW